MTNRSSLLSVHIAFLQRINWLICFGCIHLDFPIAIASIIYREHRVSWMTHLVFHISPFSNSIFSLLSVSFCMSVLHRFITHLNDSLHRGKRPFSRATQVNFVITSERNHCLSISSYHRLTDPAQMTTHLIRILLSFSAWLEKHCGQGAQGREGK